MNDRCSELPVVNEILVQGDEGATGAHRRGFGGPPQEVSGFPEAEA